MSTTTESTIEQAPWSVDQRDALLVLRTRYQQTRDLFTAAELERMQFVRWLYRTGKLTP